MQDIGRFVDQITGEEDAVGHRVETLIGALGLGRLRRRHRHRRQIPLIFVQIAGAVFVEGIAAQPRAESQMGRGGGRLELGGFGNFDLKGGGGLASLVQPGRDLGADRLQSLLADPARLAQPHQKQTRDAQPLRRRHLQEFARFAGKPRNFQRPVQRAG